MHLFLLRTLGKVTGFLFGPRPAGARCLGGGPAILQYCSIAMVPVLSVKIAILED